MHYDLSHKKNLYNNLLLLFHITKYIIMKCTAPLLILGLVVTSCKKESRTERSIPTDSIINDTVTVDTISNSRSPVPALADTIHHDSISGNKNRDTVKSQKNKVTGK